MERRSNQAESPRPASMVRQFSPSRIEHQLLAQVFEFLVSVRRMGRPEAFGPVDDRPLSEERQCAGGRTTRGSTRSAA